MKMWHTVVLIIVVYLIGVKFPGVGRTVLGKVGL
jgi:hypothetical protein